MNEQDSLAALESAARYMLHYESGKPMAHRSARVYKFAAYQVRANIDDFLFIDELVELSRSYSPIAQLLENADLGRGITFYREHAFPELHELMIRLVSKG